MSCFYCWIDLCNSVYY